MKEVINSFSGGMNLDLTKLALKNNQYRDCYNFRLNADSKDSTTALINVDGNILSFTFPTISNVLKIKLLTSPPVFPVTVNFTINAVTFNASVTSFQDITDLINNDPTLSSTTVNIKAATGRDHVLVWGALTSNTTQTLIIAGTVISGVQITTFIPLLTPKIMGWTTLRDKFILFSTNSSDKNPGGHDSSLSVDSSSASQIWELEYDPVSLNPTLTLLRNNFDDFTLYHPFRKEGQAEGRYETKDIQKVYWTDNFNERRFFNTKDANGFALDPSLLNARSPADFSVPILQVISDTGGSTKAGIYQCAYRLKNTGGGATIYSKCSNIVSLAGLSTDPFRLLNGAADSTPPLTTPNTITWKIDGLDTDYDRLEIVILYRQHKNDLPLIDQVFDEPVPNNGTFQFTYTGLEPTIPIDINTFVSLNNTFTHCKTITSKDNLLLAGNTRNQLFDIDFDARAYRFNAASSVSPNLPYAQINDSQGNSIIINSLIQSIPENHDCINPNQHALSTHALAITDSTSFRFQSDGTTLGGEGPNIKYHFATKYFEGDQTYTGYSPSGLPENWRFCNPQTAIYTLNGNSFANNGFYGGFKSPYISSAFKGYQHDEVYPYAIKFYDKTGRPGFSKWIGDIKMPVMNEQYGNGSTTVPYPITNPASWQGYDVGVLYPVFTVDLSSLSQTDRDKIGGFEIIRCERTTADKSVLAAGVLLPAYFDAVVTQSFYMSSSWNFPNIDPYVARFFSPEFMFTTFPGVQTGDTIKLICSLDVWDNQSGSTKNYMIKDPISGVGWYDYYKEYPIGFSAFCSRGSTITDTLSSTPTPVVNYSTTSLVTMGEDMVWINVHNNPNPFPTFSFIPRPVVPYALYKKTIASQYGGNTFSARANREYISTGHFQKIDDNNSSSSFTIDILGGDVFTNIFDHQTLINISSWGSGVGISSIFYPVTSVINTEWRYSTAANAVSSVNHPNAIGYSTGETYEMNPVYSSEDNTKLSFSKPDPFIAMEENDNRIWASAYKFNGELTDSWGIFAPLDFEDADGQYGPLNNLLIFKGVVIGLQNQGIFTLPVNQRALINDNSASTLQLGTGTKLSRPAYISTSSGSFHQFGNIVTEDSLYYFDVYNLTVNRLSGNIKDLTEIKGVSSYLTNNLKGDILKRDNCLDTINNPKAGLSCTYDNNFGEVLFTFHDYVPNTNISSQFTLVFNELFDVFTGFLNYEPQLYLNNKRFIIAPNSSLESFWLQNYGNPGEYFTFYYPSTIRLIINPKAKEAIFDNFEYISECIDTVTNITDQNTTLSTLRVSNDYQNSDYQALTVGTNLKREKRIWQMSVPRSIVIQTLQNPDIFDPSNLNPVQLFKPRIKGNWMQVDLTFNTQFRKIIIPFFKAISRFNYR